MHHLDATACQSEGERPHGAVACPGYELVDGCSVWKPYVSLEARRLELFVLVGCLQSILGYTHGLDLRRDSERGGCFSGPRWPQRMSLAVCWLIVARYAALMEDRHGWVAETKIAPCWACDCS
jgi:hypothetical protein